MRLPLIAYGKEVFSKLRRRLLPGFALVQRADPLQQRTDELSKAAGKPVTALDALLDLVRLNIDPVIAASDSEVDPPDPAKPDEVEWQMNKRPGWLVPLPIGYAGISPLYAPGEVGNARDDATPFRFVESLYSLGQWISPHRMTELKQLLWTTEADEAGGLYRCINHYPATLVADHGDVQS